MRLVVVDNYDSFTHNLVDLLERLGATCDVVMHDAAGVDDLIARRPDGFVVSPGPCTPAESGVSLPLATAAVRGELAAPFLGVCLGHQAIGIAMGASLTRAARPIHGKTSAIVHGGDGLFAGLPQRFEAARYNSLLLEEQTLPPDLEVTARTAPSLPAGLGAGGGGEIMALRHVRYPVDGLQFHPESFLTELGPDIIKNWLDACRRRTESAA